MVWSSIIYINTDDVNVDGSRLPSDAVPIYHRDSGGVVIEGFCIHPFRLGLGGECGQLQLNPMG